MAEIFVDTGLDWLLDKVPVSGSPVPGNLYIGLFTNFSPSGVGTSGTVQGDLTEPTSGGYARLAIATSDWNATPADINGNGNGRKVTTSASKDFVASGADYDALVNGFFISTALTSGTLIFMANFDDETAVDVNDGDTLAVTPWMGFTP